VFEGGTVDGDAAFRINIDSGNGAHVGVGVAIH
jgi:hypothetical protein